MVVEVAVDEAAVVAALTADAAKPTKFLAELSTLVLSPIEFRAESILLSCFLK